MNSGDGRVIEMREELLQVGNGRVTRIFACEHGGHPRMFHGFVTQVLQGFLRLFASFFTQFSSCCVGKGNHQ